MDDETLLVCSGNRARLLLDLNALGYRLRPVPDATGAFAAFGPALQAPVLTRKGGRKGLRYCRMRSFDHALEQARADRRPLLITGEPGTGKEVLARAQCQRGPTSSAFHVIHCQSLRWAAAEGRCNTCIEDRLNAALAEEPATVLLDEIGDLGPVCQQTVLEMLSAVDPTRTRVVVTSRRPMDTLLGTLLPGFISALDFLHLHLPPLRDHPADIPMLLEWFAGEANIELGTSVEGFGPAAIRQAIGHTWPGNVRELRNVVFRAVLDRPNGWIEVLPIEHQDTQIPPLRAVIRRSLATGTESEAQALVQQFERELLEALNTLYGGNKSRIARALQVSRNTLKNRLRSHKL